MQHIAITLLVCLVEIIVVGGEKARYDNYKVYSLRADNYEHLNALEQLEADVNGLDFWTSPVLNKDVDIMVPPHKRPEFEEIVNMLNISSAVKIENVQA